MSRTPGVVDFVSLIEKAEELIGVQVLLGSEKIRFEGAPPRIVLELMDDTWGPPNGYAGQQPSMTDPATLIGLDNPRVIWTQQQRIRAHIWGADPLGLEATNAEHITATEKLRNRFVQAVHSQRQDGYFYKALTGQWQNAEGAALKFGRAYTLLLEVWFSVTMPEKAVAVVKSTNLSTVVLKADGTIGTVE